MSGVLPGIHRDASLPKYESVVADVQGFAGCGRIGQAVEERKRKITDMWHERRIS